jgi:hypothetical protein
LRNIFAAGKSAQIQKARRTGEPLPKLPTSKAELDKLLPKDRDK